MAPIPASSASASSFNAMSRSTITALILASFFGATVVSASTAFVLKTLKNCRQASDKAKLLSSIPSSSAPSEYTLEEGTGMPIRNGTAGSGSTTIWSAGEQVIDSFVGTDVVLTRPSVASDGGFMRAARCVDDTTDESGKVRSGLTVPLGKYVAKNDAKAIRTGCPATPTI